MQGVQGPYGQHRPHRPGSRSGGQHLGHHCLNGAREASAPVVRVLRDGPPPGLDVHVPRFAERVGNGDHTVGNRATLLITDPVDRRHDLSHEPPQLVQYAVDDLPVHVLEVGQFADGGDVGDLVQDQANVG